MVVNVEHTVSAGALVGVLEISATFPLEYLKRAMQLQQQASPRARASGTPRFASLAECATHTIRHHGALGLYRGFSGWLVFAGPRSAIRFATFDALSRALETRHLSAEKRDALCGFGAGLAEAGLAQTPNQAIAVKMIHDQSPGGAKRFRTFWHATRVIYAELGVRRGFFCGLQPALVKGACTNAIRFPAFNAIKRLLEGGDASVSRPLPAASLCAGAAAGALSAVATQPIDTVMAAMQGLEAETFRKHGLVGTTRVLVEAGGVHCLYYGLMPRLARVTLEVALQFTLFEQIGSRLDAWLS